MQTLPIVKDFDELDDFPPYFLALQSVFYCSRHIWFPHSPPVKPPRYELVDLPSGAGGGAGCSVGAR